MIEIIAPDDFHHHLRDGHDVLTDLLGLVSKQFVRVIVMPNLQPPIKNLDDAQSYKDRIRAAANEWPDCDQFQPMMTLYLTDNTEPSDILRASESGIVYACKLYPAGATTNSSHGVTSLDNIKSVLLTMEQTGMPLLIHGEVTDNNVDIFDRESVFIERVLNPLIIEFPKLKIVMEHITTAEAVEFISSSPSNVAATITAHHLLYNRSDIFRGGICPHMYCLPILKHESHRQALLKAATSGNPKFFIGTDSAPHAREKKVAVCGCAGIFTGHAAIELYAEAFESVNAIDMLEGFTSLFGQKFYGIPINSKKIKLIKEPWIVPDSYSLGEGRTVRPLRAGEYMAWKILL